MVQIVQNKEHSNAPLGYTNFGNFQFGLSPKMCAFVLRTFCHEIFSINKCITGKGTPVQAMNAYGGVDF